MEYICTPAPSLGRLAFARHSTFSMRFHSRDIPPPLYVGALVDTKTSVKEFLLVTSLFAVTIGFLSCRWIFGGYVRVTWLTGTLDAAQILPNCWPNAG